MLSIKQLVLPVPQLRQNVIHEKKKYFKRQQRLSFVYCIELQSCDLNVEEEDEEEEKSEKCGIKNEFMNYFRYF